MKVDFRFDTVSFFLVWAALLITAIAALAFILDIGRARTRTLVGAALLLWIAGSMYPLLSCR